MGEARRRKLAGNTESNPKYRKTKKSRRKDVDELSQAMMIAMMGSLRLGSTALTRKY